MCAGQVARLHVRQTPDRRKLMVHRSRRMVSPVPPQRAPRTHQQAVRLNDEAGVAQGASHGLGVRHQRLDRCEAAALADMKAAENADADFAQALVQASLGGLEARFVNLLPLER